MSVVDNKLAVLIDPGQVSAFSSLLDDYPFPMLPAATKPLVQHWIERLSEAGYKKIIVMLEHLPEKVRSFIDGGQRWGVEVSYANIRRGQNFKTQRALVDLEGVSQLFVADLQAFPTVALIDALVSSQAAIKSVKGLSHWAFKLAEVENVSLDELDAKCILPIASPKDLWQVNMDLLSSRVVDPLPFGFEAESGVWVASNCKIGRNVRSFSPLVLGESSILSKGVIIGPNAVVADKCVLDEGAFVKDSIVMGRTFVGSHIAINNMVVSGDMVYRIDDDVLLHINDIEILSRRDTASNDVDLLSRLFALFTLLALMLPAAIFAVVIKLKGSKVLIEETVYLEDGRDLSGLRQYSGLKLTSLNISHQAWHKLPWLWWVVTKKLALVGSSPRKSADFVYPSWVTDAEEFVPGVINQADLNGVDETNTEGMVIADVYQLAQGDVGFSLSMWGKWLLSLCKF